MKRLAPILIVISLLVLFFLFYLISNSAPEIGITGVIEEPYLYELNGEVVGIDADITMKVCKDAGVKADLKIVKSFNPITQGAELKSDQAIVGVSLSKQIIDHYKWVGPISKGTLAIFAKEKSGIPFGLDLESCREIESIAVLNMDCDETNILKKKNFKNLVYYDNYEMAIKAFKNDEVAAIASDKARLINKISTDYYKTCSINIVSIYHTVYRFIAFPKDVDEKFLERCQKAINELTIDGTLLKRYQEYFPDATKDMVPGIIQLHTEIDPPYNYYPELSGAHTALIGSSIDIVNEIQADMEYQNPINVGAWSLAYEALQYMPNYALFTTARTAAREDLFQWVGPISATRLCFYTLSKSGIRIKDLNEAKALGKIATPNGWFSYDYLVENGFNNILASATTSEEAIKQLVNGEVDALFLYETGFNWLCDEMGVKQTDISKQFTKGKYEYFIAFSKNTSSDIINEWQKHLDDMKRDGRFYKIWNKWYKGVPSP